MRRWRDTDKQTSSLTITFLDRVDNLLDREAKLFVFVEGDFQNTMKADGLLVSVRQDSTGTATGVAYANLHGRAIVVSDPNHVENQMLTFLATTIRKQPP